MVPHANLEQAYNVVLTVLNRLLFAAVWLHDALLNTELIQFSSFLVSEYAVGKAREVKSELTQPNTGNSQRNRRNIGLTLQDSNALADKRNKTNAIEYQKERLDNRSLKYILVCNIAE